jgi:uncharacterized protein
MLPRSRHVNEIQRLSSRFPVVALLGARQVGKTTLARQVMHLWAGPTTLFDLENPIDLARLADPMTALDPLTGLVVLDEIQRMPDIFSALRVLADRKDGARFLVLGSAAPSLLRQSAESLAGRVAYSILPGFGLDEVGSANLDTLWLRGRFPSSFLAATDRDSAEWRRQFVTTFLERDLPQLGVSLAGTTLRRFWTMLAHWHGQVWNASEFARSFGVSEGTIRRYLDLLTAALVVRQLPAWHENLRKRQVRAPKIYLTDSGLLHTLLGLEDQDSLLSHPRLGASWEGLCLDLVVERLGARPEECHFWATHGGAELDLLVIRGRRRLGFEIKRSVVPTVTRSMHSAIDDLGLDELVVVHAGTGDYPLTDTIRAVSLANIWSALPALD